MLNLEAKYARLVTGFVRPNVSPSLFTACAFLMFIVLSKCYYIFVALCVFLREGFGNFYGYNTLNILIVCLYVVYIATFRLLEAILYKRRLATKIFRAKMLA